MSSNEHWGVRIEKGFNFVNLLPFVSEYTSSVRFLYGAVEVLAGTTMAMSPSIYNRIYGQKSEVFERWKLKGVKVAKNGSLNMGRAILEFTGGHLSSGLINLAFLGWTHHKKNSLGPFYHYSNDRVQKDQSSEKPAFCLKGEASCCCPQG